jgi:hypothetical protein
MVSTTTSLLAHCGAFTEMNEKGRSVEEIDRRFRDHRGIEFTLSGGSQKNGRSYSGVLATAMNCSP